MPNNKWILKELFLKKDFFFLQKEFNFSDCLMQLLFQRHINTITKIKQYFKPNLSDLHDPFLMKDMEKAVIRILSAIEQKQNILIFGDYDVDGITSVSMMYSFLKEFYYNVYFYIPNRSEGYGISIEGINYAQNKNISLIITLDCGIKSIDKINYANSLNIDVIVSDHHRPDDYIPDTIAVLNPLRKDCFYPFKYLSGCGVGFKLIQAIAKKMLISEKKVYSYLDLVVVSIASDLVAITGENRILAKFGMQKLIKNPRVGLKALISKYNVSDLNISNIIFSIAPKINATGRIDHANKAVQLLIAENETRAKNLVSDIIELNAKRKKLDVLITQDAMKQIKTSEQENNFTTIVYNELWHQGVIGIVASRLIEYYYKPTLVFTKRDNKELCASARSVKGFDLYHALENCSDLLIKFGGHKLAAGLSLKEENFNTFKEKFEYIVKNHIKDDQRVRSIDIDLEIPFDLIDIKFIRMLTYMEPFGPGNMIPLFLSKNLIYANKYRIIGKSNNHIIFSVYQKNSKNIFEVIGFRMAYLLNKIITQSFDMVYSIDRNVWKNKFFYRLIIHDIKFHDV